MKYRSTKARIVLYALLLAAALCMEQVPEIGQKMFARAALVGFGQNGYTVGLLCQLSSKAADSAQAEEQYVLIWGNGDTLSSAYLNAENSAGKNIEYALCDTLLLCGRQPAQTAATMMRWLKQTGKGRTAARVLLSEQQPENLKAAAGSEDGFCEALYSAIDKVEKRAPRLYTVAHAPVSIPLLQAQADGVQAGDYESILFSQSQCIFSAQDAALLRAVYAGAGTVRYVLYGQPYTIRLTTARRAVSPDMVKIYIEGTVKGIAADSSDAEKKNTLDALSRALLKTTANAAALGRFEAADVLCAYPSIQLCYGSRAAKDWNTEIAVRMMQEDVWL